MDDRTAITPIPKRRMRAWWLLLPLLAAVAGALYWWTGAPSWRLYYAIEDNEGLGHGTPRLYSVRGDGRDVRAYAHPCGQGYSSFERVSPDGRFVAYTDGTDVLRTLYVSALDGAHPVKIDEADGVLSSPLFSPDGTQIVYFKWRAWTDHPVGDLFLASTRGGPVTALTNTPGDEEPIAFSSDGRRLYYIQEPPGGVGETFITMALDLTNGKTYSPRQGELPKPAHGMGVYALTTRETGKTITVGVDGTEEDVPETVDDLYLTPAFPHSSRHIARGYRIQVLGWGR